jgi:ABC-2 type transport system ATP-binding protein
MSSDRLPAIETDRLTKRYGRARGITDVSLRVERGEIFGFLGPNGAGKTTTIRTLLDFIRPTAGSARIFGLDTHRDYVQVHRRVGNLPGDLALDPRLTGEQVLEYSTHLRGGVPPGEITRLAERLDLDLRRRIREYSKGTRQKVGLILALMPRPDLLILDEPTGGLDPLVQQTLYELLEEVRADGRTIFFSSHVLPEVERLCDRVAIVREGELVAVESVDNLKSKAVRRIDVVLDNSEASARAAESFKGVPGVQETQAIGSTVHIVVHGSLDALIKAASQFTVLNFVTYEPSLEEVFLSFYRRDGSAAPAAGDSGVEGAAG